MKKLSRYKKRMESRRDVRSEGSQMRMTSGFEYFLAKKNKSTLLKRSEKIKEGGGRKETRVFLRKGRIKVHAG